jgi:hypothetical protein
VYTISLQTQPQALETHAITKLERKIYTLFKNFDYTTLGFANI